MLKPFSKKFVNDAIVLNPELHSLVRPVVENPKDFEKLLRDREKDGIDQLERTIEDRAPLLRELAEQLGEQAGNVGKDTYIYLGCDRVMGTRYEAYVRPVIDEVTQQADLQFIALHNGLNNPGLVVRRRYLEYPVVPYQSSQEYLRSLQRYDGLTTELIASMNETPEQEPVFELN